MRRRCTQMAMGVVVVLAAVTACGSGSSTSPSGPTTSSGSSSSSSAIVPPTTPETRSHHARCPHPDKHPHLLSRRVQRIVQAVPRVRAVPEVGSAVASALSAMTRLAPLDAEATCLPVATRQPDNGVADWGQHRGGRKPLW